MARLVDVKVDDADLKALMRKMRAEADGKQLRKDLIGQLRAAVAPAAAAVQGRLRAIPHSSTTRSSPALGSYLASRTKVAVRLGGRRPGVSVRIATTPNLRGFAMAARRLNRQSWRHRVYGRDVWVDQQSPIPGFFDDTLAADRAKYRAAVVDVLRQLSDRLTARRIP